MSLHYARPLASDRLMSRSAPTDSSRPKPGRTRNWP